MTRSLGGRIAGVFALLIAANVAAWVWALIAFQHYPVLLGTAVLAYSFGLRHAVDADHIAAIDNVTRKLMADGQRPIGVGLYFSLGHSSVVVAASIAIALGAGALASRFESYREIGGLIGTSISAAFLFAIAIANIVILMGVYRAFDRVKRGGRYAEDDLDLLLANRGFLGRVFKPLFRFIRASWQMYLLGFLFGLGFDTATEIGVLGISAAQAAQGLSVWSLLIFPALFTAGMALVDTLDSVLMLGAYGWAFMNPIRKLYYNLTITAVSVLVALLIGGIQALGLLVEKLALHGGLWDVIAMLNEEFGMLGYAIVGLFAASWAISIAIYRVKGYDRIELVAEGG
jgi:nickel/cobalt transporter (NiCoT) family protein